MLTTPVPQAQFLRAYRYQFSSPIRLAVDNAGAVYVVDSKRGEVVVRAADGRVIQHRRGLGRPGAIAVDGANQVYLADLDSGVISVYDSEWQLSHRFGAGDIQQAGDIAIDHAGNRLYVSDSESHRVLVYSSAGELLFDFGAKGNGDGQLLYPSGVFFDAQRNEVLVSDQLGYRIQVFSPSGDWLYCFGGTSASAGGFFQRGRLLSAPQGLWADAKGRVYVADSFEGQVKVLDRSGRLVSRIGTFGRAGGELRIPSDIVIDPFGRLFVASANNARLEVFGIDAYSDPEQYAPALLKISPAQLTADGNGTVNIQFIVPGYHLQSIQTDSIFANGIPASSAQSGDFDGDAQPEIKALFDKQALLNTLPESGPAKIQLQGSLSMLSFVGHADVEVIAFAPFDTDEDGITDAVDACPNTTVGAVADENGCSLEQYCSCSAGVEHNHYLKCVKKTAKEFLRAGLIDRKQRKQAVKEAKTKQCGQRNKPHRDEKNERDDDEREHEDDRDDGHEQSDDDRDRHKHKKSKQTESSKEHKR